VLLFALILLRARSFVKSERKQRKINKEKLNNKNKYKKCMRCMQN